MAKVKLTTPVTTVAKKDNTRVARTRVSSELVGDKPNYSHMGEAKYESGKSKMTKSDTLAYNKGFREGIGKYKKQGRADMSSSVGNWYSSPSYNAGATEAWGRSFSGDLNKKATVRDSTIPLAPTQFPE